MIVFLIVAKREFTDFAFLNLAFLALVIMFLIILKINNLSTLLRTFYFFIVALIKMFYVLFKSNLFLVNGAIFLIALNKLIISGLQSKLDDRFGRMILVSTQRTLVSSFTFFPCLIAITATHRHFTLQTILRLKCH